MSCTEDFTGVRLQFADVALKLVEGYPKFEETSDSRTAETEFIILASNLKTFLASAYPRKNAAVDGKPYIYQPALLPGRLDLTISKISAVPVILSKPNDPFSADGSAPAGTYGKFMRVHIWFETLSRDFFRDIQMQMGAQYLQISPNNLKMSDDANGTPVDSNNDTGQSSTLGNANMKTNKDQQVPAYKIIPTAEWTYKLQPFANPKWETYFSLLGSVNDRKISSLCEGAFEHTVLFSGMAATRIYSMTDVVGDAWAIDLKFSEMRITDSGGPKGWNHFYSTTKGIWSLVTLKNGDFVYPANNLTPLIDAEITE